nr:hypothetical protein CFP56_39914 [Quercus suber]
MACTSWFQLCLASFGWYVIPAGRIPQKSLSRNLKTGLPLSPPPNHALLPLTHDPTMSCIGWVQAGGAWALRMHMSEICLLFMHLPWTGDFVGIACRPFLAFHELLL